MLFPVLPLFVIEICEVFALSGYLHLENGFHVSLGLSSLFFGGILSFTRIRISRISSRLLCSGLQVLFQAITTLIFHEHFEI